MKEPLEIKFLGDDIVQIDGVKITLELIKCAMNPGDTALRTLFSVKRKDDQLEFMTYWNADEAAKFFQQ